MFEGKHIHFSPTDNKPLCSYSGKLCRQRRLNGYAFCIRHILEDKSAPFKQCSYVTRNNSQKCLNAIPTSQDRGYCHSHMQVVGMIPKTERKSKAHPVNKVDLNCSTADKSLSPTLANNSIKKDPGAVFKFEEDSSDVTDVFSYKNGLSAGTLNGKGKLAKLRDTSYNSSKDIKNNVKSHNGYSNGSTANFTTKKITDKNKNVYTAIIPASNCQNNNANKVYQSKNKSNTCWNNVSTDIPSPTTVGGSRTAKTSSRAIESELNTSHQSEEIRQFEQLKTLKQLDKSLLNSGASFANSNDGSCGDAKKLQVFPRLSVSAFKTKSEINSNTCSTPTSSSPVTNHNAPDGVTSQSSTENYSKCEIVSTSPPPPLITRSNNSIIIKTEPQQAINSPKIDVGVDDVNLNSESVEKQYISSDRGVLFTSGNINSNNCSNPIITASNNDHSNSIDKDLKNRHEFLARVRLSFKSQYKSIKQACKFSERCEQSRKQKLRDSLMRCVRIDSSICAQVLLEDGIKVPTVCSPIKIELEGKDEYLKKQEYDDYDFVDNDGSLPIIKNDTCMSDPKFKKGKGSSKSCNKTNSSKTTQKRSGKKGKELELYANTKVSDCLDGNSKEKAHVEIVKEVKAKVSSAAATPKRKLKRADAVLLSGDGSLGSLLNEGVTLNNNNGERVDGSVVKKQRLELSEMTALENELGLSLNDQSSSSHDARTPTSTHQNLNQGVGHTINDAHQDLHDILGHARISSSASSHRNQGLETVLNSVGSSDNAGTPDGVITDASFDSTFEHSTSSQPDCEYSEDDLEHTFELQIDPELESQASRLLEDNVLTEADFTELFPDNRMSDHKFGRNDLQELGMTGLEFDVNDIDYSLFANIFPNFPRSSQPESISISNQF